MGIVAHPDDLDVGAGATIAKYIQQGAEVEFVILTDGSKGSDDPAMTAEKLIAIRQSEQRAALKALGGKPENVHFLGYSDGELTVTMELKRAIVREIRRFKPDTVITLEPTTLYSQKTGRINHPDHRAAGEAVLDAVFPLARDRLTFPEHEAEGLAPHKVETVLLVDFDTPTYFEDVTGTYTYKEAALHEHPSQFTDMERLKTLFMTMARHQAEKAGYTEPERLAEGFIRLDLK